MLSLAWSAAHLFSGSYDNTIRVWDLTTLRKVQILQGKLFSPSYLLSTQRLPITRGIQLAAWRALSCRHSLPRTAQPAQMLRLALTAHPMQTLESLRQDLVCIHST